MGVDAVTVGLASAVGLVCGAYVPRVAYRFSVPSDDPPRTSCVSCGQTLSAGTAGWLTLRARCASCGVRLGPRSWFTAPLTMVACGLVAAAVGPTLVLPLFVALTVLGVALGAIDVACKRLPHDLVIPAIWIGGMWLTVVAAITGDWNALLRAAFGAAVLGALYFVLFLVPGQGMGFGDVKLAVLLGGFLGWLGWPEVILGVLVPWLLNGPVVLVLLLTGRVNRKTTLPFGPAMLAGAWVSIVLGSWLNLFGRV